MQINGWDFSCSNSALVDLFLSKSVLCYQDYFDSTVSQHTQTNSLAVD